MSARDFPSKTLSWISGIARVDGALREEARSLGILITEQTARPIPEALFLAQCRSLARLGAVCPMNPAGLDETGNGLNSPWPLAHKAFFQGAGIEREALWTGALLELARENPRSALGALSALSSSSIGTLAPEAILFSLESRFSSLFARGLEQGEMMSAFGLFSNLCARAPSHPSESARRGIELFERLRGLDDAALNRAFGLSLEEKKLWLICAPARLGAAETDESLLAARCIGALALGFRESAEALLGAVSFSSAWARFRQEGARRLQLNEEQCAFALMIALSRLDAEQALSASAGAPRRLDGPSLLEPEPDGARSSSLAQCFLAQGSWPLGIAVLGALGQKRLPRESRRAWLWFLAGSQRSDPRMCVWAGAEESDLREPLPFAKAGGKSALELWAPSANNKNPAQAALSALCLEALRAQSLGASAPKQSLRV